MKKIYVDGQLRHYEEADGGIYLDTPEMPGRRCAYVSYPHGYSFIGLLECGASSVRTSGHTFSLRAPVHVLAPEPTAVENGKKMCADCGMIALPPDKTYCAYCEAPPAPAPSVWDEIPRCLGYAIGAMLGALFMGALFGYCYYKLFH